MNFREKGETAWMKWKADDKPFAVIIIERRELQSLKSGPDYDHYWSDEYDYVSAIGDTSRSLFKVPKIHEYEYDVLAKDKVVSIRDIYLFDKPEQVQLAAGYVELQDLMKNVQTMPFNGPPAMIEPLWYAPQGSTTDNKFMVSEKITVDNGELIWQSNTTNNTLIKK